MPWEFLRIFEECLPWDIWRAEYQMLTLDWVSPEATPDVSWLEPLERHLSCLSSQCSSSWRFHFAFPLLHCHSESSHSCWTHPWSEPKAETTYGAKVISNWHIHHLQCFFLLHSMKHDEIRSMTTSWNTKQSAVISLQIMVLCDVKLFSHKFIPIAGKFLIIEL